MNFELLTADIESILRRGFADASHPVEAIAEQLRDMFVNHHAKDVAELVASADAAIAVAASIAAPPVQEAVAVMPPVPSPPPPAVDLTKPSPEIPPAPGGDAATGPQA